MGVLIRHMGPFFVIWEIFQIIWGNNHYHMKWNNQVNRNVVFPCDNRLHMSHMARKFQLNENGPFCKFVKMVKNGFPYDTKK